MNHSTTHKVIHPVMAMSIRLLFCISLLAIASCQNRAESEQKLEFINLFGKKLNLEICEGECTDPVSSNRNDLYVELSNWPGCEQVVATSTEIIRPLTPHTNHLELSQFAAGNWSIIIFVDKDKVLIESVSPVDSSQKNAESSLETASIFSPEGNFPVLCSLDNDL